MRESDFALAPAGWFQMNVIFDRTNLWWGHEHWQVSFQATPSALCDSMSLGAQSRTKIAAVADRVALLWEDHVFLHRPCHPCRCGSATGCGEYSTGSCLFCLFFFVYHLRNVGRSSLHFCLGYIPIFSSSLMCMPACPTSLNPRLWSHHGVFTVGSLRCLLQDVGLPTKEKLLPFSEILNWSEFLILTWPTMMCFCHLVIPCPHDSDGKPQMVGSQHDLWG